jgi:beta-catenin-like protein 1
VDPDELEFMENTFDALCSALNESEIKTLFLSAEGPELMVLMMKFAFFSFCLARDA